MTSPIPDRAVLEGLLEMVRMATGPDRKLDSALMRYVVWVRANDEEIAHALAEDDLKPFTQRRHDADAVPRLTGSLDAAVALVETVLPGAHWDVQAGGCAWIRVDDADIGDAWNLATPALALCAALLTAILARAGDG